MMNHRWKRPVHVFVYLIRINNIYRDKIGYQIYICSHHDRVILLLMVILIQNTNNTNTEL